MTARFCRTSFLLGLTILAVQPVYAAPHAESAKDHEGDKDESRPRYMMRDDLGVGARDLVSRERADEQDFYWRALTGNGPAAGSDPVIGRRGVKESFDFRDGFAGPVLIPPKD